MDLLATTQLLMATRSMAKDMQAEDENSDAAFETIHIEDMDNRLLAAKSRSISSSTSPRRRARELQTITDQAFAGADLIITRSRDDDEILTQASQLRMTWTHFSQQAHEKAPQQPAVFVVDSDMWR